MFSNDKGNTTQTTTLYRWESWSMVSYKLDLEKFGIESLEGDTIDLLRRRVVDIAGCLGNRARVELDGKRVPGVKKFEDYVYLYTPTSMRTHLKINNGWEVSICLSEGHFEQVSFVNNIATMRGGSHVDYVTTQIIRHLADIMDLEENTIRSCLWVFVNATVDDPVFDSETKEKLTTDERGFGAMGELTPGFLDEITGKMLKLMAAKSKEINENVEIQSIKESLGLEHGREYQNLDKLRYGFVTDQGAPNSSFYHGPGTRDEQAVGVYAADLGHAWNQRPQGSSFYNEVGEIILMKDTTDVTTLETTNIYALIDPYGHPSATEGMASPILLEARYESLLRAYQ